jgi:DNA-binding MarR family transcriptional regulator
MPAERGAAASGTRGRARPLTPRAAASAAALAQESHREPSNRRGAGVKNVYLEAIHLAERLHRQFLDVVQTELNRQGIEDVNNVQALILFNIRNDELTVGELTNRGYYLGSNVSYNLRKMGEHGYLVQERSPHDRRSVRVRLSDKGQTLCEKIDAMFNRQLDAVDGMQLGPDLKSAAQVYRLLERFWIGQIGYSRSNPRG